MYRQRRLTPMNPRQSINGNEEDNDEWQKPLPRQSLNIDKSKDMKTKLTKNNETSLSRPFALPQPLSCDKKLDSCLRKLTQRKNNPHIPTPRPNFQPIALVVCNKNWISLLCTVYITDQYFPVHQVYFLNMMLFTMIIDYFMLLRQYVKRLVYLDV